jgi:hypothetical protein
MKLGITEYNRIHKWAERKLKKEGKCFYCGVLCRTQWSNIDHKYRQDETEWQEVCAKCHHYFDAAMGIKSTIRKRTRPYNDEDKPLSKKAIEVLSDYAWFVR